MRTPKSGRIFQITLLDQPAKQWLARTAFSFPRASKRLSYFLLPSPQRLNCLTLPAERRPPAGRLGTSPNQKRRVGDRRFTTRFPRCWQCQDAPRPKRTADLHLTLWRAGRNEVTARRPMRPKVDLHRACKKPPVGNGVKPYLRCSALTPFQ